jgi:soluble lytic murein transglycosylase-like protein
MAVAVPARAEVYSYVDDEGVTHFTNVPRDPRAKPIPLANTENTFALPDDASAKRRLHRVDVTRYDAFIIEAARYYSLPPALVKAVIAAESAFEPEAVSSAGALGLMQLMPNTARALRVADCFDPRANIYGGSRYLRILANRLQGDIRLTAAAYNAGPEAVERARGVPSIEETENYVARVLMYYRHYVEHWQPNIATAPITP